MPAMPGSPGASSDGRKLRPIIVKRERRALPRAANTSWKIAYADFMTAMMCFFLLMWLLGSATDGDKKGIADYFATPLKLALLANGSGAGDSAHVVKGGGQDLTRTAGAIKRGEIEAPRAALNLHKLKAEQLRAELVRLEELKRRLAQKIDANEKLAAIRSQISLDMTGEGLRVQIVDDEGRAMFASASAQMQPHMRELLRELGGVLATVPNRLTLEGHTDATPYGGGDRGFSNWELSSDRANASRRELLAGGLPEARVLRVQGLAASMPLQPAEPRSPANRRISLIVMNREAEERALRSASPLAAVAAQAASVSGAASAASAMYAPAQAAGLPAVSLNGAPQPLAAAPVPVPPAQAPPNAHTATATVAAPSVTK
jgi:chemotaxis protein MotB